VFALSQEKSRFDPYYGLSGFYAHGALFNYRIGLTKKTLLFFLPL